MNYLKNISEFITEKFRPTPSLPSIVYHGQPPLYDNKGVRTEPEIFTKFDQTKRRFLKNDHFGFYFTPDEYLARDYAEGGNLYVCEVEIKNPYYYYLFSSDNIIKTPNFLTIKDKEYLEENEYDGVITVEYDTIGQVIALYSEQIKIVDVVKLS